MRSSSLVRTRRSRETKPPREASLCWPRAPLAAVSPWEGGSRPAPRAVAPSCRAGKRLGSESWVTRSSAKWVRLRSAL